jgi:Ca2+-binding RTX toxin-like protein
MIKMNKKFCNYNSQIESITDLSAYFKNKKMNLLPISHLFLFCIFGTIFLLIEFDTKYHPSIINVVWADVINGTENADNITGTINKDIIKGLKGNDTIFGMESGDDISGGSGDDIIYGNEGRDVLKGKAGNDRIEGGEGNDRIIGDRGDDILIGGPGNDTLTGGLGKDIFICGTATDTITDFNLTQKDSIPENDCENLKNGNVKTNSLSSQQNLSSAITRDSKEITDNKSNNAKTPDENKKVDDSFPFFGLFK